MNNDRDRVPIEIPLPVTTTVPSPSIGPAWSPTHYNCTLTNDVDNV